MKKDRSYDSEKPKFRNLNVFLDLPTYRLPVGGWVSILHRLSGVFLFLLLPWVIYLFGLSVSSELSFARLQSAFTEGWGLPGGFWLTLLWFVASAGIYHSLAGIRHMWMDFYHAAASKTMGKYSATFVLVLSGVLSLLLGLKLLSVY